MCVCLYYPVREFVYASPHASFGLQIPLLLSGLQDHQCYPNTEHIRHIRVALPHSKKEKEREESEKN